MVPLGAPLAGTNDWTSAPVWSGLIAGLVLLVATVFYEAREPEAVVPPQVFKNSIFSVSVLVTFITGVGMFGAIIYIPLFLQAVVGVKATNSGLLLLPLMVGMVVVSIGGGQILSRSGRYKALVVIGMISMTVGMYLLTTLTVDTDRK